MCQKSYKRNYHPLIIFLYTHTLLSQEQLNEIPKRTQQYWTQHKNKRYDYDHWVKPYLNQLDAIQKVHERIILKKMIQFMIKISDGYHQVLKQASNSKKLVKENAPHIVKSIGVITLSTKIKIKRACKFYGVSSDWYYREKRKINCSLHIFNRCYKQQPNQLTFNEIIAIENIVKKPGNFGKTLTTLYYNALRNKLVSCGKSTFSKYAKELGYKNPKKLKVPPRKGLRANRIFEWLHVDITYVPTLDDGLQKVAFVKDNYSKAILHYASTSDKAGSEFIKTLFQETFDRYCLFKYTKPIHILTDGGSENKGAFTTWINQLNAPPIVTKITARTTEFPSANNMAESTHHIYKNEFLRGNISRNEGIHLNNLKRFVNYYNHERNPTELYGLTPMQVIQGKIPDKHYFKEQIAEAKRKRITTNKAFNACNFVM